MDAQPTLVNSSIQIIASILLSSICWYFSVGLQGGFWYLLWFAPVPILLLAFRVNGRTAFFSAFLAYFLGRISWFFFLIKVATIIPAILISVIQGLTFALILLATRRVVLRRDSWITFLAFPVFFTLFEFILMTFSKDGTASSLAYSQANCLPLVQLASLTGILGITFVVCLIPSVIALAWHFWQRKKERLAILFSGGGIIALVFLFGMIRLNELHITKKGLKVGGVVLEEKYHDISRQPDFWRDTLTTQLYAKEISKLADQGAKLVVLPERAININKATETYIIQTLQAIALQKSVSIVVGYTNFRSPVQYNSALLINNQGKVVADYRKVHLVTGLEARFSEGKKIAATKIDYTEYGVAICKDLDFPQYIRQYGQQKTEILTIPAWDFEVDAWMHSRMAVLRGVENGFGCVRVARQGVLTVSNRFGQILAESNAAQGQKAVMLGNLPLDQSATIYSRYGDWFGWLIGILVIGYVFLSFWKKEATH